MHFTRALSAFHAILELRVWSAKTLDFHLLKSSELRFRGRGNLRNVLDLKSSNDDNSKKICIPQSFRARDSHVLRVAA